MQGDGRARQQIYQMKRICYVKAMEHLIDPRIDTYAAQHSKPETPLLKKVREFTETQVAQPQMLSGPLAGNFLKMVVKLTKSHKILELGTYTGYSALWMAEGMEKDGKIITCDASPEHAQIARRHFDESPFAKNIEIKIGPALSTLETLKGTFDLVFIDADKENYPTYYEKCITMVRAGGSILIDNTLWSGKVLNPQDPSTKAIHRLNEMIAKDSRVDNVLITVRDGIHWIVKK